MIVIDTGALFALVRWLLYNDDLSFRRHKRRTSQPITFTEKRLSMKLTEEDGETNAADGEKKALDEDDFLNFNPLTARESVSWDIQIVEAVFERYKKEDTSPVTPPVGSDKQDVPDFGSTYLTVASDVAPTPVMVLDHAPTPKNRRKSKIVVVPSSGSSDEERESMKRTKPIPAIVRRRKSKNGQNNKRTSGVVYTFSQVCQCFHTSQINITCYRYMQDGIS